ncbi:hypothetical protein IAU60_005094 [Kwoniella sp. DSM 27419]
MDDEDEFEDLLRDPEDPDVELNSPDQTPAPPAHVKRPSPSIVPPESEPKTMDIDLQAVPSENEIRLARQLAVVEGERDTIAAELRALKARYHSDGPTIPAPSSAVSQDAPATQSTSPVEIPPSLVPVLAVLKAHIGELTRDNQALRYTFLGPNPPTRGSIKAAQTPRVASPLPVPQSITPASSGGVSNLSGNAVVFTPSSSGPTLAVPGSSKGSADVDMDPQLTTSAKETTAVQAMLHAVDLERVLDRVKDLIKENEELGEMVLEAGRGGSESWERALEESRAVIASLDADLSHHLGAVQAARSDLAAYKAHFGPLPSGGSSSRPSEPTSTSRAPEHASSATNRGLEIKGTASTLANDRSRRQGSNPPRHSYSNVPGSDRRRDGDNNHRQASGLAGRSGNGRRYEHARPSAGHEGGMRIRGANGGGGGGGSGSGGHDQRPQSRSDSAPNHGGKDDRAYKRRR